MITKTLFGIDFFDAHYGGVYRGRPVLLSGRKGLGKTTIAMQFLCKGLQQDETCLMLNTLPNYNLDIYADMLGFSLANHVNDGRLILLESSNFSGVCGTKMLPPECFEQLRQIIDTHMIQRMVIDTIVPLVAVNPPERINEHIYSFMRSFDRLGVTTLMTLPKPVSPMAVRLKNALEAALPISILLNSTDDPSTYTFQVVKYMGAPKLAAPVNYKFKTGAGVVSCASLYAESVQPPAQAVSGPPPAETKSSVSAPSESPPAETKPAVPAQTWFLWCRRHQGWHQRMRHEQRRHRPTPAEAHERRRHQG